MLRILIVLMAVAMVAACSKPQMTREKYVEVMTELGCKNIAEGSPQALEMYKTKGVTQEEIIKFRSTATQRDMLDTATAIAQNVTECRREELRKQIAAQPPEEGTTAMPLEGMGEGSPPEAETEAGEEPAETPPAKAAEGTGLPAAGSE